MRSRVEGMERKELNHVRSIIERNTSKVSLRDLERKGFRKVKVLRSSDIDKMIQVAVASALSSGNDDKAQLVAQSKAALKEQMALRKQQAAEAKQHDEQLVRLQEHATQLQAQLTEAQANASQISGPQLRELQQRAQLAEQHGQELGLRNRQLEGEKQVLEDRSRANDSLRRRLEEAEARALGAESRAITAEKRMGALATVQIELDEARSSVRLVETEKRLLEELELPKLRARIGELEDEVRRARDTARQAEENARRATEAAPGSAGPTLNADEMRAVFREVVKEAKAHAPAGGSADLAVMEELSKLQMALQDIGRGGSGRAAMLTGANATNAVKLSLDALFKDGGQPVETNIGSVKVKESKGRGVGSSLNKLKSMQKRHK